jgi:hypothetical protein
MSGIALDKTVITDLNWDKTVKKTVVSRGVILVYKKIKMYVSV